jgi:multidrug transporter EmrE-like cation transporter
MFEWLVLVVIGLLYVCSAYLSYNEEWRRTDWFWPVSVVLGLVISSVWFAMVKYLDDKQRIYVYSLCWDSLMCGTFYLVPLIFFGVKLDRWSVLGLILMIAGVMLIKVRSLG